MMINNEQYKILYFPIKLLLAFLIFSELLFFLGPRDYGINNSNMLGAYLLILNVSLWGGYKFGIRKFRVKAKKKLFLKIEAILLISFVLMLISLSSMLSARGLSLINLFPYIFYSIQNPGDAYYAETDVLETSPIILMLSFIVSSSIPLGVYNWNNLNRKYKLLLTILIFLKISSWICIGSRKGIFDVLLIIFVAYIARNQSIIINKGKRRKLIFWGTLSLTLFIIYFIISNIARYKFSLAGEYILNINSFRPFYQNHVPEWILIILDNITGYLCQGYYALAVCLEMGVIMPSPMGSSWFTIAIAKKLGYDPVPGTYMRLLENTTDIDMSGNWHTMYVWLANDVTFIGVPVVIFIVGLIFGIAWKDVVLGKNIAAVPILSLITVMVFYFFANNQIMSFDFIPFVFWLIYYLYARAMN